MNYIKKIRIKNFKSLEDVKIDFKQLTFLFGPNGSGKSSFMKALMFLYKNLFPLNTKETIYKLSKDVDLLSFENITTNNDLKRTLSYEIDIEGEYYFPKFDAIKSEYFESDNFRKFEKIYPDFSRSLNFTNDPQILRLLKENSFIDFYDEANSFFECYHDQGALNECEEIIYDLFERQNVKVKLIVDFNDNQNGVNLSKIKIEDLSSQSHLSQSFEQRGTLYYRNTELYLLKDNNLSTLFKNYFNNTPFISDIPSFCSLDSVPDFPFFDEFIDNKVKNEWEKKTIEDKTDCYYKIVRFAYLAYRFVPYSLNNILSYFHLPTVREIPKQRYLIENNKEFNRKDYYGLLNDVYENQIKVIKFLNLNDDKKIDHDNLYKHLCETISKQIKYENKPEDINIKNEWELLKEKYNKLNHFSGNIYSNIDDLDFNKYYLTNCIIYDFGFNKVIYIKKNDEIGSILITDGKHLSNLCEESSGLIQSIPIIITIAGLIHKNHYKKIVAYISNYNFNIFINNRLQSNDYNILMLEQPELHLHPKLQCKIGELFSDIVNYFDDIITNVEYINYYDNRLILVETHSEHIIRKIQVLIATGELSKDKVAVYYFDKNNKKVEIKTMEIEDNGFFKEPWPDGFFDESYKLSWDLLAAKK